MSWIVRTPEGSVDVAQASERDLAYVCAIHGIPWEPWFDEHIMRDMIDMWATDIRAMLDREHAHCEAFLRLLLEARGS